MQALAARYRTEAGEIRIGAVKNDQLVDVAPSGAEGFVPTPESWAQLEAAQGEPIPLSSVTLLAPVIPSKMLCIGLNYLEHARESNMELPEAPLIFAKVNSALIGPDEPIVVPAHEPEPDYEAEVAVVIGRQARNVSVADATEYIGGITAMNDVSGRSAQLGDGQWTRGKGYDTFAPVGPYIGNSAGRDLRAIGVKCILSGEVMQDSSTSDLIFPIDTLVSYLSHQFTLFPGDVIATGTPSGVGMARSPQRFLKSGDVVEVWVEGIGTLRNPVTIER